MSSANVSKQSEIEWCFGGGQCVIFCLYIRLSCPRFQQISFISVFFSALPARICVETNVPSRDHTRQTWAYRLFRKIFFDWKEELHICVVCSNSKNFRSWKKELLKHQVLSQTNFFFIFLWVCLRFSSSTKMGQTRFASFVPLGISKNRRWMFSWNELNVYKKRYCKNIFQLLWKNAQTLSIYANYFFSQEMFIWIESSVNKSKRYCSDFLYLFSGDWRCKDMFVLE